MNILKKKSKEETLTPKMLKDKGHGNYNSVEFL